MGKTRNALPWQMAICCLSAKLSASIRENQPAKSHAKHGVVMRQSLPRLLALLVLGVFLPSPAHAGDDKAKSPEDVFKACAAAWKNGDAQTCMSHLTRDSQSVIAAYTCSAALIEKAFSRPWFGEPITPKEKEHIDAIDVVLKRHGVSEEAIQRIIKRDDKKPTPEEEKFLALGELVKDKPAFVTEMLKVSTGSVEDPSLKEIGEAKVKEVKIDGQQAKGQVKFTAADGKEKTATVYFKTESEVWKIDLMETWRNWPRPPPQVKPAPQIQPEAPPTYSRPGPLRRLLNRLLGW
jgi:hypothetical protein